MKSLILASQSPRRKLLLEQAHLSFIVIPSNVDEVINDRDPPEKMVASLASQKAKDVFERYPEHVVIGSDTLVAIHGTVLGKPLNAQDAKQMLQQLSGTDHQVLTGVSIVSSEQQVSFVEKADVRFLSLTEAEIDRYIRSGEPFDKAGAYGIQGFGATLVEKISGDYFTIVGLPIAKVVRVLKQFGITNDFLSD